MSRIQRSAPPASVTAPRHPGGSRIGLPLPAAAALLLAGLGVSGVAEAATRTVGDAACVIATTCDYASLAAALGDARLADGDVIRILSGTYLGGEALVPHISRSITIESTGGSGSTAALPSLGTSAASLVLDGVIIDAGEALTSSNTAVYHGLFSEGADVVGTDVVIRPGPKFNGGFGIQLIGGGSVDLADFDIGGMSIGISLYGGEATLVGGTIHDSRDQGLYAGGPGAPAVSVSDVTFENDFTAIAIAFDQPGSLLVDDSRFYDNAGGGILIDWISFTADYRPRYATITRSEFAGNYSPSGADISFRPPVGGVVVEDSTFEAWAGTRGSVVLAGGDSTLTNSTWNGSLSSPAGVGANPDTGGAIYAASGTLRLSGDTFDSTIANYGGAIYLDNAPFNVVSSPVDATIDDCEFLDPYAYNRGGAIYAASGTTLAINRSTFSAAQTGGEGGAIYFGGAFNQKLPEFGTLTVTNTSFQGAEGFMGALLYLTGPFQRATFTGVDITDVYSSVGGFAVDSGNSLTLRDVTVDRAYAEAMGAFVASWPFSGYYPYYPSELPTCEYIQYGSGINAVAGYGWGSEIDISGARVTDAYADVGAVGVFGPADEVSISESEFSSNESYYVGQIVAVDATNFDMTCTTMVVNSVDQSTASGVYLWNSGRLANSVPQGAGGSGGSVAYSLENDVFQEQTGRGPFNAVEFELCDASGSEKRSAGKGAATVGVPVGDSDTGVAPATPRGRFDIVNNTFVGASGLSGSFDADGTLVRGRAEDVRLEITDNIFQSARVGLALKNSPWVDGDYNLFASDIESPIKQDAALFFPAANDQVSVQTSTDPTYREFRSGDPTSFLALAVGSPGVDQGDPALEDWDHTRADIGAFGGPGACIPDRDGDHNNRLEDCNDDDASIYPGAGEVPYDTIDQDCDGTDLCDVDQDGFDSDHPNCGGTDCNDANPGINPEITEVGNPDLYANGVDEDCDGDDWCDFDGDGFFADSETCGGADCNDEDEDIHPGATEIPYNGIAEGCVRDLCDVDGDGFDATSAASGGHCEGSDCDDDSVWVNPEAPEVPYDGIDNDCRNGDECDVDDDGFTAAECGGDDCDDSDSAIHPGAEDDPTDSVDSNCDGDCDLDGDGNRSTECDGGTDCNDADAEINIDATEIPYNGIDEDCDGSDLCDVDGDGYLSTNENCGGDDCNDDDATIHPDASEIPGDGIDQDCQGDDVTRWIQGGCNCDGEDPSDCSTSGASPTSTFWLVGLGLTLWRRRRNGSRGNGQEA